MRILALVDYFVPGYKAGGPIRTLSNMIARLGGDYHFRVVTRDRDLGMSEGYPEIVADSWAKVGEADVLYASPSRHLGSVFRLVSEDFHDVLYLNSFFSWKSTIFPLILLRFGLARKVPVVLAPRGEFSQGALELKAAKKRTYIVLARTFRLCSRAFWQASSDDEAEDIRRVMKPRESSIIVAPNLLPPVKSSKVATTKNIRRNREKGKLRIVFLSRISPMKNLDYLLRVLRETDVRLSLTIYGPIEDEIYWKKCNHLMADLPGTVDVAYLGPVPAENVSNVLAQYDLFAFPTRGENFGHTVFESLSAGTPLLLSDRTPWRADIDGAIEVLSLDDDRAWINAINRWGREDLGVLDERRQAAQSYATKVTSAEQPLVLNRRMFEVAMKGKQ